MNIGSILGGTIGKAFSDIGATVRSFVTTDGDRMELQTKLEAIIAKRDSEIEATIRTELTVKQKIIEAEMASGDRFTQRMRPTIGYAGLVIIAYNYCAVPTMQLFLDAQIEPFVLPPLFWTAWGGMMSIYSIGRSSEKRGNRSRVTSFITGS